MITSFPRSCVGTKGRRSCVKQLKEMSPTQEHGNKRKSQKHEDKKNKY